MGRIIYYLVALAVPLVLWISQKDTDTLFASPFFTMTTLGQILGIWGIMLFAANLILSSKYKWIDTLFGGLDKVYLLHKKAGVYVVDMLLFHLLFMTLRNWQISFAEMLSFAVDFTNWPVNFGRIAFLGIAVVILITLFAKKMDYETKKKIHRWMGVFLFVGGLHVFFIPSDVAVNLPLRYYILTFVNLALLSYVWTSLLRMYVRPGKKFEVIEVNPLKGAVTEVIMRGPKDLDFSPGQFVFTKFKQKGFPYEEHPFSITDYTDGVLRISAKQSGDYTRKLPNLQSGADAFLLGPFGGFNLEKTNNRKQIWIAGGIGITPFMAIARHLNRVNDEYEIELFHSVTNEDEATFKEELQQIDAKKDQFKYKLWITENSGRLSADELKKATNFKEKDIFICGPLPMVKALSSQLQACGIPKSRIHFELFKLF